MKKKDNMKEAAKPGKKIDFFISSNMCQPIHKFDDGFDGLRKTVSGNRYATRTLGCREKAQECREEL
jgi:hypothetical protein